MNRKIMGSECLRFFSSPWCVLGLGAALMAPPIAVLLFDKALIPTDTAVFSLCVRMLYIGQLGGVLASAAYLGQEYSDSALRTTLLGMPQRLKLALIKYALLGILILLAGGLAALLCLLVIFCQGSGFPPVSQYLKMVGPGLISWVQLAWLSAGLSILTKSFIAPIAVLGPLILGFSQGLYSISKLARFLPDLATWNLFFGPGQAVFLPPVQGLLVQLCWLLGLTSFAFWRFTSRDVR